MAITETEAVAGLRILVAIAKADGTIQDEERAALSAALEGVKLPAGTTVDSLLAEKVNVEQELGAVRGHEARDDIYKSAYGMAHADGNCSKEEQQLLDRIKKSWEIPDKQSTFVARLFAETKDTVLPSNIQPIADAAKRSKEIREDVLKYSLLSALLGAFPIPGVAIATDLAIVTVQVKMVRDIGQYHGHKVDREGAKSLLYGLGLGTGARIAVNNIVKLVPGWGSAFAAVTSFAATFAVGKVMDRYFVDGAKADASTLKKEFKEAQKEGKAAYAEHKGEVEALEKAKKAKLEQLSVDLKDGKLTLEAYEKEVTSLG
ncbi:MAG: TerB family tellurite resistance protein [Polyangiaceae bacterium]